MVLPTFVLPGTTPVMNNMKRSQPQTFSARKKSRTSDNGFADQCIITTSSGLEVNATASLLNKQDLVIKYHNVGIIDVDSVRSSGYEQFFIPFNDLWLPD
jgi:hypothetical protein